MRRQSLTNTQKETLDAIKQFHKKNGYMPTYKELEEILGVPDSSIYATCKRIAEKGYIQQDRRPRRMKIL